MALKYLNKKIRKIKSYFEFLSLLIQLRKTENKEGLFFFFPFYHVGGAERVHIDLLSVFKDKFPWIIITNRSDNDSFYNEFKSNGKLFSIGYFGSFRTKYFRKKIASIINKHPNPVVFGCNSNFFYSLLPLLSQKTKCIDLIHAFSGKDYKAAEDWSLPYIEKLNYRVFISKKTIEELKDQYLEHNIDSTYLDRIKYIPNYTDIPDNLPLKDFKNTIHVLYVGRGSAEKRVHLIGAIAKKSEELNLPVNFTLIGDIEKSLNPEYKKFVTLTGELRSKEAILPYYKKSHIILITSTREGFPMVIMEGMAHGMTTISTDVGDIPVHIIKNETGILVNHRQNEDMIVQQFIEAIKSLNSNREELVKLSAGSYKYSQEHFNKEQFSKRYKQLFFEH